MRGLFGRVVAAAAENGAIVTMSTIGSSRLEGGVGDFFRFVTRANEEAKLLAYEPGCRQ